MFQACSYATAYQSRNLMVPWADRQTKLLRRMLPFVKVYSSDKKLKFL